MRRNKAIILSKDIGTKICIKFVLVQRRVQDFYHQGHIKILGGMVDVFLSEQNRARSTKKNLYPNKDSAFYALFSSGAQTYFCEFHQGHMPLMPNR